MKVISKIRLDKLEDDMTDKIKRLGLIFALFMLFAAASTLNAQQQPTHTIAPGETLSQIANLYGVDLTALAAVNNIQNASLITAGSVLVIPPQGTGAAQVATTYTVQRGDTLRDIAARYNTTVDALAQTNLIANPNRITPGQELTLPATGGPLLTTTTATVTTPTTTITPQVVVTSPILPRRVVNGYYTVQYGDTMFAIGRSFGKSIWDIAEANGVLNLNRIYAGQALRIPGY